MTKVYPPKSQFTWENVQHWINEFGPMTGITALTDADSGQMFELEIMFETQT